jgi:hypothetical protein
MTDLFGELFGEYFGDGEGFRVEVDWTKTSTWVDETDYVRPRQSALTAQYGRDQSTALAPTISGQASIVLDNSTRRFSPRNTASPLYGYLKPARPVRLLREYAGVTYTLFVGHTDDTPINPDIDNQTVTLSLVDWLADFRGQTITTELHRGIRTGQAIGYILDACSWPVTARDLDYGATVIPFWWEDGTSALEALERVVRSEGPPALLTVGADGTMIFRDRHHRLLRTASLTSQQTWGNSTLPLNTPFVYDEAWDHIVNHGTATVDERVRGELQEVWTSEATIHLAAGETKLLTASGTDPFYDAQVPVAGTDYTLISGTVTISLFRTSGGSTTIKIIAATTARITGLRLRARPVTVRQTEQVSATDEMSRADYGTKTFPGDLPWCGPGDAAAVLKTAVTLRAQPLPIIRTRILIGNDTNKMSLLTRDLSDRVTVIEAETSTNGPFYIETIAHEAQGPFDHAIIVGLEAGPVQVSPAIRLNTSGLLGSAYLTNTAIDPENLIILGSNVSGHRLGEGHLAL